MNTPKRQTSDRYPSENRLGSRQSSIEIAVKPRRATGGRHNYIVWVVLAAYSLFLVYRALHHGKGGDGANVSVWQLHDLGRLLGWIGALALGGIFRFAYFVPVGFMAAVAVRGGSMWFRRFTVNLAALLVASVLAALVSTAEFGRSQPGAAAAGLVIAMLGCLFGTWMGTTWLRGWRARLWLLPKIALLALLAAFCSGIILWLSVEKTPLPFEAARVTSAEKRRLVHLVRNQRPRSIEEGQTQTLRLTEHDINVLLSWGLSLRSPNRKAKVNFEPYSASISASVGVTPGRGKTRYLNVLLAGNSEIKDGVLSLTVDRCRIGRIKVPSRLLNLISPAVASRLSNDRLSEPFIDAIRATSIDSDSIEITYARLDLPPGFREDLFGPASASEDMLASARAQVDNLLSVVNRTSSTQPSFSTCLETVFSLARDRSVQSDPVTENRAGIFALGMLLGHPRVEEFLGPVLDEGDKTTARGALHRIPLRGRSDWTKHFCVSAAIALLSDEVVSDAAGLLKEELDAGIGGSGFSFSDLLADRAGTTFAGWATRDEAAARAMQDRIAGGFRVEEFFPPAADLPEGIGDAELQARYGGVGGEEYRRLVGEIERRIARCAAYR